MIGYYGSSVNRKHSEEELSQAKNALKLLKSKRGENPAQVIGSLITNQSNRPMVRSRIDSEEGEYRKPGGGVPTGRLGAGALGNKHYRKTFAPEEEEEVEHRGSTIRRMNTNPLNSDNSRQIATERKENPLGRLNNKYMYEGSSQSSTATGSYRAGSMRGQYDKEDIVNTNTNTNTSTNTNTYSKMNKNPNRRVVGKELRSKPNITASTHNYYEEEELQDFGISQGGMKTKSSIPPRGAGNKRKIEHKQHTGETESYEPSMGNNPKRSLPPRKVPVRGPTTLEHRDRDKPGRYQPPPPRSTKYADNEYNNPINTYTNTTDEEERTIGGTGGGGSGYNIAEMGERETSRVILRECRHCGRKFNPESLSKHEIACEKVFMKKRKQFDTSKHRAEEIKSELQKSGVSVGYNPRGPNKRFPGNKQPVKSKYEERKLDAKPIPKWKAQSAMFRNAMRSVQGDEAGGGSGGSGGYGGSGGSGGYGAPNDYQETDFRVPCPHCKRKFAQETADRHIPSCAEKAKRNQMRAPPKKPTGRIPTRKY